MVTAPPPTPPGTAPVLPRRSVLSRVSGWYWVAAVLAVVAVGAFLVITNSHTGVQVAVAARDLGPGEPVRQGDVRFADLDAPPAVLAGLLRRPDVAALRDYVTTRAVARGQLLSRADVTPSAAPGQQRSMSVPIDAAHAVAGTLRPGDVIDVVDASTVPPTYVVTGARVLEVHNPGGSRGLAGATGRGASIIVAVSERDALALAGGIQAGKLEVVRATGAPAAQLQTIPVPSTIGPRR